MKKAIPQYSEESPRVLGIIKCYRKYLKTRKELKFGFPMMT